MRGHRDIFHLFSLGIILISGLLLFTLYSGNQPAQLIIGIITSIAYAFWGVVSHSLKGAIHTKVVVEYVLVSIIAILILVTVLRT